MNTFGKVAIVAVVLMLMVGSVGVIKCIGWNNQEVELRNTFNAQEKVCHSYFDKMWKILKQQAGVTDKYASDFKNIYGGIMEGRYKNGGALFKMITESNPEFDSTMYKKLMVSIESQREGFHRSQSRLVDIQMQHNNLRQKFPSSLVVGSVEALEVKLITSTATKQAIETGEENNLELFGK